VGATLLKASGPDNHDGTNRFEIVVYDTGFDGMGSALGAMRYDVLGPPNGSILP
jgi:hypothetical protein